MNLKEWRKSKGWSQADLAEKLGANQKTYGAYETGRNDIPHDVRAKLKKMGYAGPWPREETQEATVPGGGSYVTEADFAEWRGYWRGGMEGVLERLKALEDQVQKLRQQVGSE